MANQHLDGNSSVKFCYIIFCLSEGKKEKKKVKNYFINFLFFILYFLFLFFIFYFYFLFLFFEFYIINILKGKKKKKIEL